jgi:hypothetical protein
MTNEEIRGAGMDQLVDRHTVLDKFVCEIENIYLQASKIELASVLAEKRIIERQMIIKGHGR